MNEQPLAWVERQFPQRCIHEEAGIACTKVGTYWAVNAQGGRLGPMCKRHATALVDLTIQLALRTTRET